MRNVYVHDMEPPSFVFGEYLVHDESGELYRTQFTPDSSTVRLEVDKTTCTMRATETFSRYEMLQGLGSQELEAHDNCDVVRDGDAIGAHVVKKIYDMDDNLVYDSSSHDTESLITTGPGHYKMEIIAVDDYSDDLDFPSNRSENMHTTVMHVDLELFDEEPPSGVSSCPADMTGDKEVLIDPDETEAVVYWD